MQLIAQREGGERLMLTADGVVLVPAPTHQPGRIVMAAEMPLTRGELRAIGRRALILCGMDESRADNGNYPGHWYWSSGFGYGAARWGGHE